MSQNQIIDAWLKTATQDLCDAAKERIALEIATHFNDAVALHLAQGLSPTEAQIAAWSDLGSAEIAAKRFRKKHLTKRQADGLRNSMIKRPKNVTVILISLLLNEAAVILSVLWKRYYALVFSVPMMLSFILTLTFGLFVSQFNSNQSKLLVLMTRDSIGAFLFIPAAIYFHSYLLSLFFAVTITGAFFYWLRLWQKAKNDRFNWA
jgi:hypothetical protein